MRQEFQMTQADASSAPAEQGDESWWRPSADERRNLVKAGALILAEIERLDRIPAPTGSAAPESKDAPR